ncbi:hypothetical protein [Rhizobium sp. S163]|uniref:hypothetical protein n=1 Tax=Rhizobium sp. S163 TaxID=3055039 RepID=UPI0025A9B493|nr:hypothetical protein [Rhizobium sp. S163]MDM9647724.1 hypothetical protein [Rhizobium sp. S163]
MTLYKNLFDAEARVAGIYPIALIGDPENPPEWVKQFAEDVDCNDVVTIFRGMPEIAGLCDLDAFASAGEHAAAIAEAWVHTGREGFIVRTEICHRRYVGNGSNAYYSGWGIVKLGWIYVETIDGVEPAVLAKATAIHDVAKAETAL